MSKIHHRNIIHLYDIMQDSLNFFLVMDYCAGGDLLEHQRKQPNTRFPEFKAVQYLADIRDAFLCLKTHHVMHRDIKLENLFVDHQDRLLIGDFGFAKEGLDESFTKLGSHNTMAPEIFMNIYNQEKKYNSKCDLWSVGVVFHIMLYGKKPYFSNIPKSDQFEYKTMIQNLKEFDSKKMKLPGISEDSANLIRKMLVKNPKHRICNSSISNFSRAFIPLSLL